MKKRILFTVLIVGLTGLSSLKAQFSIGPGVAYGTNIDQIGILGNVTYNFAGKWGVMGGYTYFFKKQDLTWSSIDVDATYNFDQVNDKNNLYALAGIDFLSAKVSYLGYSSTGSNTGLNLGVGWKTKVGQKMYLVPEARYTIINNGYLRLGVRLIFGL